MNVEFGDLGVAVLDVRQFALRRPAEPPGIYLVGQAGHVQQDRRFGDKRTGIGKPESGTECVERNIIEPSRPSCRLTKICDRTVRLAQRGRWEVWCIQRPSADQVTPTEALSILTIRYNSNMTWTAAAMTAISSAKAAGGVAGKATPR